MTYYVKDYFTDETIEVFAMYEEAVYLSKQIEGSQVVDENDNVYYTNIELPF